MIEEAPKIAEVADNKLEKIKQKKKRKNKQEKPSL